MTATELIEKIANERIKIYCEWEDRKDGEREDRELPHHKKIPSAIVKKTII